MKKGEVRIGMEVTYLGFMKKMIIVGETSNGKYICEWEEFGRKRTETYSHGEIKAT